MSPVSTVDKSGQTGAGVLEGLRIIELGHYIAAPFATRILADLGAEVIKVEQPGTGDPARGWGAMVEGRSVWWSVHARNKKSITLDLGEPAAKPVLLDLVRKSDGIVENFRPGQLEKWGFGPDVLEATRPGCVLVRISGYGQTGPYRDRPSFGVIGEAQGGIRYLTNHPPSTTDLPPVRAGVSFGDSVAGLYAVIGLLAALWRQGARRAGSYREVDVALYEAVFSLLEGSLPEYGRLGIIRQPTGSRVPTAAPTNAYRCRGDEWILIAGNSDRIFTRLMGLIGRLDLANDPGLASNAGRITRVDEIDHAISGWSVARDADAAIKALDKAQVPASRIYTIADCVSDPQYEARGMIQRAEDPFFGSVLHPGVVPRFADAAAAPAARWTGPGLGAHNVEIYGGLLGYAEGAIAALRRAGVI